MTDTVVKLDRRSGEYRRTTHEKKSIFYKTDSFFDNQYVSIIILLLCGLCDGTVFLSLFKLLSYDSTLLRICQVAGMLIGFDAAPIFIGIMWRRINAGLSPKKKLILGIGLTAFVVAVLANIYLRLTTVNLMSPTGEADAAIWGLCVFSMVLPVITSFCSFFVSYMTFHPLKIRLQRADRYVAEKRDELRQLQARKLELELILQQKNRLYGEDRNRCRQMANYQKAVTLRYCQLVRTRIKEYLAGKERENAPADINALSREDGLQLLARLDAELKALYGEGMPASGTLCGSERPCSADTTPEPFRENKPIQIHEPVSVEDCTDGGAW